MEHKCCVVCLHTLVYGTGKKHFHPVTLVCQENRPESRKFKLRGRFSSTHFASQGPRKCTSTSHVNSKSAQFWRRGGGQARPNTSPAAWRGGTQGPADSGAAARHPRAPQTALGHSLQIQKYTPGSDLRPFCAGSMLRRFGTKTAHSSGYPAAATG